MTPTLFVRLVLIIMFVLPGALALYAGVSGSRWFFSSHGTEAWRKRLGLAGSRLFYALLGLLLLACGIYGLIDPLKLMPHT